MSDKIKEGLARLDPKNDNHWTEEGLPRLEAMRLFTGQASLTREQVTDADPAFNRKTATTDAPAAALAVIASASEPVIAQATEAVAPVVKQDLKATLEQQHDEATKHCDAMLAVKQEADHNYSRAREALDNISVQLDRLKEPEHKAVMNAIQQYQAVANEVRRKRGEAWTEFRKTGLRLTDILPQRAPIDAARQRKR